MLSLWQPSRNRTSLLQRTGLTLDDGRVVFGIGGNFGDCSACKGRVIAAPENGGKPAMFTMDAAGHVWVTAGNGPVCSYSHAYVWRRRANG